MGIYIYIHIYIYNTPPKIKKRHPKKISPCHLAPEEARRWSPQWQSKRFMAMKKSGVPKSWGYSKTWMVFVNGKIPSENG